MRRQNKRIPKEIRNGYASKEFEFYCDEEGKLRDPDDAPTTCFLKFKPKDGPYRDQTHVLKIKWTWGPPSNVREYPTDPPLITFMTPIFHANVGEGGAICLDILRGGDHSDCKFKPIYGVEAFFESIICLLITPNPNSPLNGAAARAYNDHHSSSSSRSEEHERAYKQVVDDYYNARRRQHARWLDFPDYN